MGTYHTGITFITLKKNIYAKVKCSNFYTFFALELKEVYISSAKQVEQPIKDTLFPLQMNLMLWNIIMI